MFGLRIGAWLKRYTYDGLGRLVETRSPYIFVPGKLAVESYSSTIARVEQFYHDGARRIQEVVTDPLDPQCVLNKYGFDGLVELVQSGSAVAAGKPWRYLRNEYLWGPGDATMGVGGHAEELLVMYDRAGDDGDNSLVGRNPW